MWCTLANLQPQLDSRATFSTTKGTSQRSMVKINQHNDNHQIHINLRSKNEQAHQALQIDMIITRWRHMKNDPKVEIYIGTACGFCTRALRLLDTKNIAYQKINITMNPGLRADMRWRTGGRQTVPQIFINNKHIGDCEELVRLENTGRLNSLLSLSWKRRSELLHCNIVLVQSPL